MLRSWPKVIISWIPALYQYKSSTVSRRRPADSLVDRIRCTRTNQPSPVLENKKSRRNIIVRYYSSNAWYFHGSREKKRISEQVIKFILIIKINITLIVSINGSTLLGFGFTMKEAFIELFMQLSFPLSIIWLTSFPLTIPASVSKISFVYWMKLPMENQNINIGAIVS